MLLQLRLDEGGDEVGRFQFFGERWLVGVRLVGVARVVGGVVGL